MTPAIIRAGDVLIAVSTSGRSCRQSRLIKDNLRKHLDSIESSDLLVLGTSHVCLPSAERSPYHLLLQEREAVGAMIRQVWGVHEFFLLNTCNRIEVVAAVSREAGTSGILRRLMRLDQLRPDCYYYKHGFDAFAHLCLVTAGMDSQTPGEFHVVSQLKDAVEEAEARGWSGSIIRELCDAALHVSRDIRREVGPLLEVSEIEDVAVRYLAALERAPAGREALVIGTGVVGQGLVAGLLRLGYRCSWAFYRNPPVLSEEGARHIDVVPFDDLPRVLPRADVVVSAVNAPQPVLTVATHGDALNARGAVWIDLGMPRNIDPAFAEAGGGVQVVDLDTLKHWSRASDGTQERVAERCVQVMDEHRAIYERIRRSMQGDAPAGA